jgi:protein tyrosine phosphatase
MKLQKFVNIGNPVKSKKIKMIITETQFKALAKNILNEQEKKTIRNSHLIKIKSDAKK